MCKALGSILLLAVTLARFGLPVAYADTVRSIATAEELAAALLDNSVSVARIDARHIDLSDAAFLAWDNSTFPFLRTANITILGNTDLPEWPLLQLRAKKKLMLADHVHFTLRWLYIYRWRNDNFVRLPGWDTLAPSKPGSVGVWVTADQVGCVTDVCYPLPIMGANYGAVERPASVPGVQTYTLGLPQTGCVNDSSVLKNRCWSDFSMINDVIFVGYDNDLAGKPVPNNYLLNISHTQQLCRSMLDAECLKVNQPIACMLVAMRGAILSAPVTSWLAPSPAANATLSAPTASPAALTGPSGAAPQTDTEGGGGGEDNTTAIIVGSVVGGVAFLAIVAGVAAWALHRRKRGPSQDAAASKSAAEAKGTDRSQSGAAKCGKPWAQPGSEATGSGSGDSDGGGARALTAEHVSVRVAPAASCVYAAAAPTIMNIPTSVITGTTPFRSDLQFCSPADGDTPTALSSPKHAVPDHSSEALHKLATSTRLLEAAPLVTLLPRILGKGAFGRVQEGEYMGQRVAVKLIVSGDDEIRAGDTLQATSSLVQELEVLGRCEHPNIVRVLAACLAPPRPCLVLELCETSLDKLLYGKIQGPGGSGPLPLPLVLHIAGEVAKGLDYLHPTVIHRDLKPANVLLNEPFSARPVVKLSDFGVSRIRASVLVTETPEAGTAAYLAPECFDINNVVLTHQADMYSFGVLLWEMLAGSTPWPGLNPVAIAVHVTMNGSRLPMPPPSGALNAEAEAAARWPPKLTRLIRACWEKDPRRRPAAAEVVKQLALAAEALESGALVTANLTSGDFRSP